MTDQHDREQDERLRAQLVPVLLLLGQRIDGEPDCDEASRIIATLAEQEGRAQFDADDARSCIELLRLLRLPLPIADIRRQVATIVATWFDHAVSSVDLISQATRVDRRLPWQIACDAAEVVSLAYRCYRGQRGKDDRVQAGVQAVRAYDQSQAEIANVLVKLDGAADALNSAGLPNDQGNTATRLAWCVKHCDELRRTARGQYQYPWWHRLMEVARFAALDLERLVVQLDGTVGPNMDWHTQLRRAGRGRVGEVLLRWADMEAGAPPPATLRGTPEALQWMHAAGIEPRSKLEDARFEFRLCERRNNKEGHARVIEGYGMSSQHGPVYVIRMLESGRYDRKRIEREGYGSIEYSECLGYDEDAICRLGLTKQLG